MTSEELMRPNWSMPCFAVCACCAATRDDGHSISSGKVSESCAANTSLTHAHRTDAPVLSFDVTDDDDDFAQRARPRRDRRLPMRYCTGESVATDTLHIPSL